MSPPADALPLTLGGLRNARLTDGSLVDLDFTGAIVSAVRQAGKGPPAPSALDVDGMVVFTAGVEPHAHLDKALIAGEVDASYTDLATGIREWHGYARNSDEEDFYRRAKAAALAYLANGVTAIRTHVEVFAWGDPLVAVRALVRVRRDLTGVLDMQLVVLVREHIIDSLVVEAIRAGADLVGGSPHTAADPGAELSRLVSIARAEGVGIDIHADERLDAASLTVAGLAAAVAAEPLRGTVTASHCVSLGLLEPSVLSDIARSLAAAGVGVITLPHTNLFLQGRDRPVATPRGIAPVRALLAAGVTVAAGADNLQDTLTPIGSTDPLINAALLTVTAAVSVDEALTAVTVAGRAVLGLPAAGPVVGAAADLVGVRADGVAAALTAPPTDRVVIHAGRLVCRRSGRLDMPGI
ncbi:amidohydrolase family protein [Mycolicibacterium baixiangningiae]|uniref:amidohydrolase family protein n=1 Tax=Mycolicibacterium baixiangningiae TaxID=2761578 RepID=UPI0018D19749|nr:amidohydrolase family protein [Mycolicibacterium baixiangningiae]